MSYKKCVVWDLDNTLWDGICLEGNVKVKEDVIQVIKELDERGIPRQGYDIVDGQGKKVGEVTSGTMSPSLGKGIGMGYVPNILKSIGTQIHIQIRKNAVPATIVKLPFYKG